MSKMLDNWYYINSPFSPIFNQFSKALFEEHSLKMLKIILTCFFCIILLNSKAWAAPLELEAQTDIIDDVAFYKIGTYSKLIFDLQL